MTRAPSGEILGELTRATRSASAVPNSFFPFLLRGAAASVFATGSCARTGRSEVMVNKLKSGIAYANGLVGECIKVLLVRKAESPCLPSAAQYIDSPRQLQPSRPRGISKSIRLSRFP